MTKPVAKRWHHGFYGSVIVPLETTRKQADAITWIASRNGSTASEVAAPFAKWFRALAVRCPDLAEVSLGPGAPGQDRFKWVGPYRKAGT